MVHVPSLEEGGPAGVEGAGEGAGHEGGEGGGNEGAGAEGGQVVAALGGQGGKAADEDADGGDVGEAAESVGKDDDGAGGELGGRGQLAELPVADDFGEDEALAQQPRGLAQVTELDAEQPRHRGEDPTEDSREVKGTTGDAFQRQVEHGNDAEDGDEQGADASGQLEAVHGAGGQGGDGVAVTPAGVERRYLRGCLGGGGLREHELGDESGGGDGEDGGGNEVAGDVGESVAQEQDIERENGGGDSRHAAGEDGEQLGTRHPGEVRSDHGSRLDAEEYVGRPGEGFGAGEAQAAVKDAAE